MIESDLTYKIGGIVYKKVLYIFNAKYSNNPI